MAAPRKRRVENVAGDFYVDSTCIDCDTCRWLAPENFEASGEMSRVFEQPHSEEQLQRARMALLACPVSAIGSEQKQDLAAARTAFPERIEDEVSYCGFCSDKSFGASSYFIQRAAGNVLIDSPRFTRDLRIHFETAGGIDLMFLSHCDDVADHTRYHEHFSCKRLLHRGDVSDALAAIELQPDGDAPVELDEDLLMIPVPGHTRGSACLLYRERFLFTGDHLWWDPRRQQLSASRSHCWYDWERQIASMRRLTTYRFEWVLPGHGRRIHLPAAEMATQLEQCIDWMEIGI